MGKSTAMWGKTSGKVGGLVYATSGGEQIVREYNPNVSNPSTQAQVNQRARMKLMSQISAALAPVIAIPKDGLVSGRNQFVKKNFAQSYASDGTAQVTYENLQITNGNAGLPSIVATRNAESGITIQLAENADAAVSRVVYIMYRKTSEQTLQLVQSVVVEGSSISGTFPATLIYTEGDLVFYAYGMKDLSAKATANYGNMNVANAVDVARLIATRSIASSDYQYTETRGATMYADENEISAVPEGSARVFVTAFAGGSVSGGGIYTIGQNATVVATPNSGYQFVGWRRNGSSEIVSSNASYTFEVEGTTDLVAFFESVAPGQTYTINLRHSSATNANGTLVKINNGTPGETATIEVSAGESITIEALPGTAEGVSFSGWRSSAAGWQNTDTNPYTFIPNGDMTIIADWEAGGGL